MQAYTAELICSSMLIVFIATTGASSTDECTQKGQSIKGTVNHGNYEFEYESWVGDNCRQYRIRNKPGKPLTPVKWMYHDAVFIDTNLPACKQNEICQPTDKVDPSRDSNKSDTIIGFGINKDEHLEKPPAFVESDAFAVASQFPFDSQSAYLSGTVADARGLPVSVNLKFEPVAYSKGAWTIRFMASQTTSLGGATQPIEVSWKDANKTYFIQRIDPGTPSEWRFVTDPADPNRVGGKAVLTMIQDGKTIASTTTAVPAWVLQ